MAASSPLHRDASASRQPSSHSVYCMPATNAALPSHKHEGLVGPLRPWSDRRSCGGPLRPRPLPFAHASHADARTKTTACARAVRVRCCPRICQATTMRRTAGIKNNIGTRVERREKASNSLPPYFRHRRLGTSLPGLGTPRFHSFRIRISQLWSQDFTAIVPSFHTEAVKPVDRKPVD